MTYTVSSGTLNYTIPYLYHTWKCLGLVLVSGCSVMSTSLCSRLANGNISEPQRAQCSVSVVRSVSRGTHVDRACDGRIVKLLPWTTVRTPQSVHLCGRPRKGSFCLSLHQSHLYSEHVRKDRMEARPGHRRLTTTPPSTATNSSYMYIRHFFHSPTYPLSISTARKTQSFNAT